MILNKPITEMLIKQAEEKKDGSGSFRQGHKGKKKRRVKKVETKIFFQFLVCDTNFIRLKEGKIDEVVDNLFLLGSNRRAHEIFVITSN
jgi:tRNA splicing endonuclease